MNVGMWGRGAEGQLYPVTRTDPEAIVRLDVSVYVSV